MKSSICSFAALAAAVATVACSSDTPTTPQSRADISVVLNQVTLAPQAAIMAAGTTLQLAVSAIALDGTPISSYDTVTYLSSDSSRVRVSPTGLITATAGAAGVTDNPVTVSASVRKDGVTQQTQAYVAVVPDPGTAPTFAIVSPQSTEQLAIQGGYTVSAELTYLVAGHPVQMNSSAIPLAVRISPSTYGTLTDAVDFTVNRATDSLTVYASVNVFGTMVNDSVTYSLGDPTELFVFISSNGLVFNQGTSSAVSLGTSSKLYLRQGGTITFQNNLFSGPSYIVGVSFTRLAGDTAATDTLHTPAPRSGLGGFGRALVTFPDTGTFAYRWTGDATSLLSADKAGAKIVVR